MIFVTFGVGCKEFVVCGIKLPNFWGVQTCVARTSGIVEHSWYGGCFLGMFKVLGTDARFLDTCRVCR